MPKFLVTLQPAKVETFLEVVMGQHQPQSSSSVASESVVSLIDDDDCWMFSGTSLDSKFKTYITTVSKENLLEIYMCVVYICTASVMSG